MKEADFVSLLQKQFDFSGTLGIGDDTSVEAEGERYRLITKDVLVENVHFTRDLYRPDEIALRSLAVNVSDIAAMGGEPHSFYIGLGFPADMDDSDLKLFYSGIHQGCEKWDLQLGGGDFSRSDSMFVSITMIGYCDKPVLRSGASPGEYVCVTGTLGNSALGLRLIQKGVCNHVYTEFHKVVEPEVAFGKAAAPYISSMMDLSDGLALDLQRLVDASETGARVDFEMIPIEEDFRAICNEHDIDVCSTALAGGEDFRLLFTVSKENCEQLRSIIDEFYIIGVTNDKRGCVEIFDAGNKISIKEKGYDHFNS